MNVCGGGGGKRDVMCVCASVLVCVCEERENLSVGSEGALSHLKHFSCKHYIKTSLSFFIKCYLVMADQIRHILCPINSLDYHCHGVLR